MNVPYELEDIEDYLQGRMSESDRKAFELALQSDAQLASRLEALQGEAQVNRLLREAYLMEQFAQWGQESNAQKTAARPKLRGKIIAYRKWMLPIGIAASLAGIICVALIFHWFGSPAPPPAMADAQPREQRDTLNESAVTLHPGGLTERARDSAAGQAAHPPKQAGPDAGYYAALADSAYIAEDFNQALMGADHPANNSGRYFEAVRHYASGRYREALKLLEKPEPNQLEEFLYLRGYTYYQLKQYDKAEADFHAFRNFPVSDRKMDAQWCEVFCMLKQMPASRERLNRLLSEMKSHGDIYSERAAALQKALDRK